MSEALTAEMVITFLTEFLRFFFRVIFWISQYKSAFFSEGTPTYLFLRYGSFRALIFVFQFSKKDRKKKKKYKKGKLQMAKGGNGKE